MGKKIILVIGAGPFQLALVQKASQLCDVVLAAPVISDAFKPYIADELLVDVRDFESILAFADGGNRFGRRVDGVITDETDIPVYTVARVAEALGLSGIEPDVAHLFTNKSLMRSKMAELGIKVLPNKTVTTLDEAVSFYSEIGGTVIIKPVDAQGSRGVQLCHSTEELHAKFPEAARWSTTDEVIVERYATGREFVIEGLALDYEFCNLCIGDTVYFDIEDSLSARERTFPTTAPDDLRDRALELNTRIITGFGLKQGITHSEFVMEGDDIFLIETAARGGGAFISSDLIPLSCGLQSEEFLVKMALGEIATFDDLGNLEHPITVASTDSLAKSPLGHCCYVAFYIPVGEILAVRGVQDVLALPYVHNTQIEHLEDLVGSGNAEGQSDKTSRYLITIEAPTREELERRMNLVRSTVQADVRTPEGEVVPLIWY
ncbi:MAG: ATP-grasp domain-containing protein [Eggerthellaceae bacterium]|nr:ATP-grasp domain-containing protein [Eggerthellaceae bacterium]